MSSEFWQTEVVSIICIEIIQNNYYSEEKLSNIQKTFSFRLLEKGVQSGCPKKQNHLNFKWFCHHLCSPWEDRALRNGPVDHFSEGARMRVSRLRPGGSIPLKENARRR